MAITTTRSTRAARVQRDALLPLSDARNTRSTHQNRLPASPEDGHKKRPRPANDISNVVIRDAKRYKTSSDIHNKSKPSKTRYAANSTAKRRADGTDTRRAKTSQHAAPQQSIAATQSTKASKSKTNPRQDDVKPAKLHNDEPIRPYRKKVVNGIQHELERLHDRLQPSLADMAKAGESGKRNLRSQEATRYKSELSAYFPEYDEVIGNDPVEHHILDLETPIVIVDSSDTLVKAEDDLIDDLVTDSKRIRHYGDDLFTSLTDSQVIEFDFLEAASSASLPSVDPLSDDLYLTSHKKAERLEKSIRNNEKGRAQHEKEQIIRLLEALQGPDWLRVMGVNGVTEGKKRDWVPAREHFIQGCIGILDKFNNWTAEEKRRKLERDRSKAEAGEHDSVASGDVDEEGLVVDDEEDEVENTFIKPKRRHVRRKSSDSSDDSASKQLKEEVSIARSRLAAQRSRAPASKSKSNGKGSEPPAQAKRKATITLAGKHAQEEPDAKGKQADDRAKRQARRAARP